MEAVAGVAYGSGGIGSGSAHPAAAPSPGEQDAVVMLLRTRQELQAARIQRDKEEAARGAAERSLEAAREQLRRSQEESALEVATVRRENAREVQSLNQNMDEAREAYREELGLLRKKAAGLQHSVNRAALEAREAAEARGSDAARVRNLTDQLEEE